AWKQRNGNEYGHQHQRSGDDRAGDFFHADARGSGRVRDALFHVTLDVFDDHNRVVHHESGGQSDAEQGGRIDGKNEQLGKNECTHQRDRDGNGRNDRRAPALEEKEDHEDDDDDGFHQRLEHFTNRLPDRDRGINRDLVLQSRRKTFRQLGQFGNY